MKKIILLSSIICINVFCYGQDKKFIAAMEKNTSSLDTAKSIASYKLIGNSFERIANAEPKQWLPDYYIALCYIMMANLESNNDKVDDYADKASKYVERADSINPNNSEIYVLKGWAAASRIKVNPMMRGQKFGTISATSNEKAKSLDPTNPRPYYMLGMGKYYTPPAFGGGEDKALPLFEEAVKRYKVFKPSSSIMPNWGQKQAEDMLAKCKKQ